MEVTNIQKEQNDDCVQHEITISRITVRVKALAEQLNCRMAMILGGCTFNVMTHQSHHCVDQKYGLRVEVCVVLKRVDPLVGCQWDLAKLPVI